MIKNISVSSFGCSSQDLLKTSGVCPICNNKGESVSEFTVKHLVTDDSWKEVVENQYRICMNKDCDIVYYNVVNSAKFLKDQIKVPIWFKKDANPKYACYCSKVTEEQVIDSIVKHGAKTVQEVNAVTGAMKNANCKENNPMGVCCHKIIQEVINKELEKK